MAPPKSSNRSAASLACATTLSATSIRSGSDAAPKSANPAGHSRSGVAGVAGAAAHPRRGS